MFYDVAGSTVEVLASVPKPEQPHGSPSSEVPSEGSPSVRGQNDLSRFLREAETQEIVITRHGKPAGVLIGFKTEDDWLDYRLENDPRFLQRVEQACQSLCAGRGVKSRDVK